MDETKYHEEIPSQLHDEFIVRDVLICRFMLTL